MTDDEFKAEVRAAFQAFNERRFADFASHMTDDVVESYPQSRERLVAGTASRPFTTPFDNPRLLSPHD